MTPKTAGSLVVVAGLLVGSASAQVGDFPKGTYAATIRGDKWTITFDDKGKFTLMRKTDVVVEGSYKVTKDKIEIDDARKTKAELHPKPGTYSWKLEGMKLNLAKIEDEWKPRVKALTGHAWTKEK